MQFQVPQFIEIEDKIIGPLTFKQFLFVVGGCGGAFIFYQLPLWGGLKFFLIIFCLGLGAAFAFLKIGHKTLLSTVEDALIFYSGAKLYLWKKVANPIVRKEKTSREELPTSGLFVPTLSESKLKDLGWALDVQTKKERL